MQKFQRKFHPLGLNLTFSFPLLGSIEWNWKDVGTNYWLLLWLQTISEAVFGLKAFTGLPLNFWEARSQQTFFPILLPSLPLPHLLSHPCFNRSQLCQSRGPHRELVHGTEIPFKNKPSYNFCCFAVLFFKVGSVPDPAQLREPGGGDGAVGSDGSCYATERKVHETPSPAGPPHLVEIQHQRWKEKSTTRWCRAAPIWLVRTACAAIAPQGIYSLLGERMFQWQCNPLLAGYNSYKHTLFRMIQRLLCCFTNTCRLTGVFLPKTKSNLTGTQRARERLSTVSTLTAWE